MVTRYRCMIGRTKDLMKKNIDLNDIFYENEVIDNLRLNKIANLLKDYLSYTNDVVVLHLADDDTGLIKNSDSVCSKILEVDFFCKAFNDKVISELVDSFLKECEYNFANIIQSMICSISKYTKLLEKFIIETIINAASNEEINDPVIHTLLYIRSFKKRVEFLLDDILSMMNKIIR